MNSNCFAFRAVPSRLMKVFSICGIAISSMFAGGTVNAALIEISSASFSPAGGYGIDSSENPSQSPTLLNVVFSTSTFSPQSFTLSNINDFMTFNFGTVQLAEPNAGGGITAAETDDLGVVANLTFTNPIGSTQSVNAIGTATAGSVTDAGVDYTLAWTPLIVNFGLGGSFEISLSSLSFDTQESLTQQATIRLLSLPQNGENSVPLPNTLALFGLGLMALGYIRVRKTRC